MHSQPISSKNPGLVLFLIDQSGSMREDWGGGRNESISQLAADALNKTLYDLALNACVKDGRPVDRVHVGAYQYSSTGSQSVDSANWALQGINEGPGWANASDWVTGYHSVQTTLVAEDGDQVIERETPVWIFPEGYGGTPMVTALTKASAIVRKHVAQYPDSYPPIVINITDGWPTDGDWGDVARLADEITGHATNDGGSIVLNIQLTRHQTTPLVFPTMSSVNGNGYPEEVGGLANSSSLLPAKMLVEAKRNGIAVREGAIGLVVDADWRMLTKFLKIGTTLVQPKALQAPATELGSDGDA